MRRRAAKREAKRFLNIAVIIIAGTMVLATTLFIINSVTAKLNFADKNGKTLLSPQGSFAKIDVIKKKLDEKNIIFDNIFESSVSGQIEGQMRDGPKVIFSKTLDAAWQVNSLQLIMQRLTIDNKKPVLLDLTRLRPIVKF